jgi:2-polyprenyl-3-methyl-5-hydroxy-6-metoxy-1,4-benzoquinol methylase
VDKTSIAVDVFDRRAQSYQDKFMDTALYHDTFDMFCNHITHEDAHILDVACGPGNITQYLLQKRPSFKILGIDLAPNMLALAQANNPNAAFQLMDIRDITSLSKKYNGIICGFGLPYLSKEEAIQFINNASAMLYPGGALYISTMEDDYSMSGFETSSSGDKVFIHYHEADYLLQAFADSHVTIADMQRKQYTAPNGANTDLVIVAVKQ